MSLERKEIMEITQQSFEKRIKDEKVKFHLIGFDKTLQFDFIDNPDAAFHIIFQQGNFVIKEGKFENPEFKITTTTIAIRDVVSGRMSAYRAFMKGKLKSKIRADTTLTEMGRLLVLVS